MTHLLPIATFVVAVVILLVLLANRLQTNQASASSTHGMVVPEVEFQRALGRLDRDSWQALMDGDFEPLRKSLHVIDPPPREIVKKVEIRPTFLTDLEQVEESLEQAHKTYRERLKHCHYAESDKVQVHINTLEAKRDQLRTAEPLRLAV